jgi:pimeloyl-ACP methyl ester carboxylesterase
MAIWTAEIKELETLYESLKGQLPELEKELGHLIKTEDENVVMLYSRRCLEVIITDLCECELKRPRKTEPLKGIIDKLNKEEKVPSHIFISMDHVNSLSTFGTHPKKYDPEQVRPVLINLTTILKWYTKYKGIEILPLLKPRELLNDEQTEIKKIKPELKGEIEKRETINRKKYWGSILFIIITSIIFILGFVGIRLFLNQKKRNYAQYELIPEIIKMIEDNYTPPFRAFELTTEAEKYIPNDSLLKNLWPKISESISLQTQPEGAKVFLKDYDHPTDKWEEAGITPFENRRVPLGYKRIKIEKDGFQTIFITSFGLLDIRNPLKLDSVSTLPQNMVRIPSQIVPMTIIGLEGYGGKHVGAFLVDRFEVTNKEYKQFMDAEGYSNKSYWNFPIYLEGKEITWDSARKIFVDKTGKQGPASWEVGKYPDGEEDYPVAGVSWYEASAYAAFVGKRLPTVYHWNVVAECSYAMNIIPFSNFNEKSTVPVGSMDGMSSYGIYDIAGNVREWCYNGNGVNGESYNLGGGWNDQTYSFNWSGIQPSIDRSLSNGFRCMMELPNDSTISSLSQPIRLEVRDYRKEKPVDDKTFNIIIRQYAYDRLPLNEQVIATVERDNWNVEKVTLDAGYNNDRLIVYLFIPKETQPPYQPVILFPGGTAFQMDIVNSDYFKRIDFIIKSRRVLVYPILKGFYERKDELKSDSPDESVLYKDHVIMWRKDIGRTIDYLETRNDIQSNNIGYYGVSSGGRMGGLYPAVERRIKAVVLHVGGLSMKKMLPEVDPLNFLPRIYQPTLMLNGKYDPYFPVETSQKPMLYLLGTPEKDKKLIIYDTGHLVPRTDLIKETLAWYDKYLGRVK